MCIRSQIVGYLRMNREKMQYNLSEFYSWFQLKPEQLAGKYVGWMWEGLCTVVVPLLLGKQIKERIYEFTLFVGGRWNFIITCPGKCLCLCDLDSIAMHFLKEELFIWNFSNCKYNMNMRMEVEQNGLKRLMAHRHILVISPFFNLSTSNILFELAFIRFS